MLLAGGDNDKTVEVFDKTSNSWIELKPMKMSRSSASSVVYKGQVLVTGGVSENYHVVSSMEKLSLNACSFVPPSWSDLIAHLPRPLKKHCTVVHNGRLIVLGGADGRYYSDMIYELQLNFPYSTKVLAKLPSARPKTGCGVVLVDDKIFIFGGGKGSEAATPNVTMYDITKNKFKELEPLPYGVCNMATVKYGENVVLAGGSGKYGSYRESKNTVISYNIKTQKSTELLAMTTARSECCAVVDGNSVVVMGGKDQFERMLSSVEVFDFKTSKWSNLPSMTKPRNAFIAEIV